jgi:hypothetical protein
MHLDSATSQNGSARLAGSLAVVDEENFFSEVFHWRLAPFRFTGRGWKLRSSSHRMTWCFEKRTIAEGISPRSILTSTKSTSSSLDLDFGQHRLLSSGKVLLLHRRNASKFLYQLFLL